MRSLELSDNVRLLAIIPLKISHKTKRQILVLPSQLSNPSIQIKMMLLILLIQEVLGLNELDVISKISLIFVVGLDIFEEFKTLGETILADQQGEFVLL
jgi:hypothetical protein